MSHVSYINSFYIFLTRNLDSSEHTDEAVGSLTPFLGDICRRDRRYGCHTYVLSTPSDRMDATRRLPLWLRNPQYTGENRCVPCTLVNLLIAAGLAVSIAILSIGWALVVFVAAIATIAVRGYLVPGTPTLTKRYLPERILALFDKAPNRTPIEFDEVDTGPHDAGAESDASAPRPTPPAFDAAEALIDTGVLVDDPVANDFILDASFRESWERRARELADRGDTTERGGTADRDALARFLDVDRESVSLVDRGYAYVASIDAEPVGHWESRPAFVADIAASNVLAERWEDWSALPTAHRSELLGNLRLFVETCPTCDGSVTLDSAVVESCCRQYDVLAATCGDCGTRLFEADVDPEALERIANAA